MRKSTKNEKLVQSTVTEKLSTCAETTLSSTSKSQRTPIFVFKEKIKKVKIEKEYSKKPSELESSKRMTEQTDYALAYLI